MAILSTSNGLVKLVKVEGDNDDVTNTPQQWIEHANERGIVLASVADILAVGYENKDREAIESMQEGIRLTTSTHHLYNRNNIFHPFKNSTLTDITHNYGSKVIEPKAINGIVVPYTYVDSLNKIIKNQKMLKYFKALADKMDMGDNEARDYILTSLENLKMKTSVHDVGVNTATKGIRRKHPQDFFCFDWEDEILIIDIPSFDLDKGHIRQVVQNDKTS